LTGYESLNLDCSDILKLWQVFPLLIEKFSFEEQASLVWQFLCSIPVNVMRKFFPWLSSSISPDEYQDMLKCMYEIVPKEKLLQKVNSLQQITSLFLRITVAKYSC